MGKWNPCKGLSERLVMNCIEKDLGYTELKKYTMKKGTVLYYGNRSPLKQNPFLGKGQTGRPSKSAFLTNDKYAASIYATGGTLYEFILKRNIALIDLNFEVNMDYVDGKELGTICSRFLKYIKKCPYSGIYIGYPTGTFEIALCRPMNVLRVVRHWDKRKK